MARFDLGSLYEVLETSPIGTQFQGPGGRQWVKTVFGLRKVEYPETAPGVVARAYLGSSVPGGGVWGLR